MHWTEKHTHRDCALYTGEESRLSDLYALRLSDTVNIFPKVEAKAGVETRPPIRSFSGTVRISGSTQLDSFQEASALLLLSLQERTVGGEDVRVAVGARVVQPATRNGAAQQM